MFWDLKRKIRHVSLKEYLFVYFNPLFQRVPGRTGRNIYYKISSLLSPDTSSVKLGHFSCSLSQCGKVAKCISPSPNTWFPGVSEILLSTILVTIAILDFHKTLYLPIPTLAHVIQLSFSFLRVEIHVFGYIYIWSSIVLFFFLGIEIYVQDMGWWMYIWISSEYYCSFICWILQGCFLNSLCYNI